MGVGQSFAGAFGVGTETTFGVGVNATQWIPILNESIKPKLGVVSRQGIYSSRMVQEHEQALWDISGDISTEIDGDSIGQLLYYWNGQKAAASLPGSITAAPTVTAVAGGSLANGTYNYRVASVWQNLDDNRLYLTNPPTSSGSGTAGGGNNTLRVTWVNPTDNPASGGLSTRWTRTGTVIFRTPAGGSPGTETFLTYVNNAAATQYDDNGSVTLGTEGLPPTVTRHSFLPASPIAGTDPHPSFSITKVLDLAGSGSHRIVGCKCDTVKLSFADKGGPSQASWGILASRLIDPIANPSPTFSVVKPFMNWKALLYIGGTLLGEATSIEINGSNGMEKLFGLDGNPFPRAIRAKMRSITGTLSVAFENQNQVNRLLSGTEFSIVLLARGQGVAPWAYITSGTDKIYPWWRMLTVHLSSCIYEEAGGLLSGSDQMIESLPFRVRKSAVDNFDVAFYLDNTIAAYA